MIFRDTIQQREIFFSLSLFLLSETHSELSKSAKVTYKLNFYINDFFHLESKTAVIHEVLLLCFFVEFVGEYNEYF